MNIKKQKIYPVLLFGLIVLTSFIRVNTVAAEDAESSPPAQIAAAPARVTVDISKGRAGGSVRVFNLGTEPVSINTQISHWTMDQNNRVQVIAPTRQSLDQWLIVNPLKFTIPPGKQQVVRYSIRPRATPDNGEHRAMLFFNQVSSNSSTDTIDVNFRMGVAIYGTAGHIDRVGRLHNLSVDYINQTAQITADIESVGNGNVRMDGQITIWPKTAFPGDASVSLYDLSENGWNAPDDIINAVVLSSTPILPGSRRIVKTRVTLPSQPGDYIVHINGRLGDEPVRESLALNIP